LGLGLGLMGFGFGFGFDGVWVWVYGVWVYGIRGTGGVLEWADCSALSCSIWFAWREFWGWVGCGWLGDGARGGWFLGFLRKR